MENIDKLREWISDADSEFFYISTVNDRHEFEYVAYSGYEYFFETAGYPKDRLTFEFVDINEISVIVSTESSFLKGKYEITSNILRIKFVGHNLAEIVTDKFSFSIYREKVQGNITC
ncbi:hypothetical protein G7032_19985 [Pseudomonas monteilii]|uniref:hypothetical protein n=1 Tax=Pseudomonas TaxID=286 RepID=UPI001067A1B9|nr:MULTISPECIES: hypothetical protein [Pseudomonas]MBA1318132.1 hypothetical protein [Pseudomonas monteilii]MQT40057.1 hypothetical protein [Pseudomonas sp. FSL R10-0765]TEP98127.1 hypothetical protein IPC64_09735 [Pseudomonas aeruginosa]TEQ00661.1 hypothetical protein IPC65_24220 [Pseudomonas aeruginosa]TEQ11035.1 hypothetical protein IPC66_19040 [Pseudomonas aeruginosa]